MKFDRDLIMNNGPITTKEDNMKCLKACSINICGLSDRSRFTLDRYCHETALDVVAVQESFANLNRNLTNMDYICDLNDSSNKGTLLYVNNTRFTITQIPEISNISKNIDTCWGLVCGKGSRYIVGSVYLRDNCCK